MNTADVLEVQRRKVLAILKKLEGGGADAVLLIRELADDLATQLAAERARLGTERSTAESEHDGGYSKSHGYGAAHGGPTGPDDAPATADPGRTTSG